MTEILSNDDLFSIAETVWSSMLGLELSRADDVDGKVGERTITSCVQITGDWEGACTIECSPRLAGQLASSMFAMELDELDDEMIRDAMGELANMTGGNVKGVAPGENTLALPTVSEGEEGGMHIAKSRVLNRVVGTADGEPIVITVFGKEG
jgi:chemotaxis protein CheX